MSKDPDTQFGTKTVINAAGKLTALGGSALSENVSRAMAEAATHHYDLVQLRRAAGNRIAGLCGAEAACVTSGAAAGITIACAALVSGEDPEVALSLPNVPHGSKRILLQAGHQINFGAPVEQMIRLSGALPLVFGAVNSVRTATLKSILANQDGLAGFLYVQSHHCVQENMIALVECIGLCRQSGLPVLVDAAAEEDLETYIAAGADLVIYSGGKAFGGPTCGFIVGRKSLVRSCELQFTGIARTMKVGKEQIAGLIVAMDEYASRAPDEHRQILQTRNQILLDAWKNRSDIDVSLRPDEAGRDFSRVAVRTTEGDPHDLVKRLVAYTPSIRTRNHHLDDGVVLFDSRELTNKQVHVVAQALLDVLSP